MAPAYRDPLDLFRGGVSAPRPRARSKNCVTIFPCAACCPGTSWMHQLAFAFDIPSYGFSGSATLYDDNWRAFHLESLDGGCDGITPCAGGFVTPDGLGGCFQCCPPAAKPCCSCACTYGMKLLANGTCTKTYATCDDYPAVGTYMGQTVRLLGAGFGCQSAAETAGGCNPPPGGCGAENSFRYLGQWVVNFDIGVCVAGNGSPILPCPTVAVRGLAVDCTTMRCRCECRQEDGTGGGWFIQFKGVGCVSADPGWFDPDATVTITAAGGATDCPDHWPCPGSLARMSDAEVMAELVRRTGAR